MEAKYIDHMGDDLTVVNAARVSFKKKSEEFGDKDAKLVNYLAKHGHWTPFGHAMVTLHLKTPIFTARQLFKHQVGLVVNEVSRRYVDDEPEFFMPISWRGRPPGSIKQGSGEEIIDRMWSEVLAMDSHPNRLANHVYETAAQAYKDMLVAGVAPEQARMVLPQAMYTEWWWTGSLAAWARICTLRLDAHAQLEVQSVAKQINEVIAPLFPVAWKALLPQIPG
jgi:thymidylate synthase (FAD)